MHIVFARIEHPDPDAYVFDRLSASCQAQFDVPLRPTDATVRRLAEGAVADLGKSTISIAQPEAFMALTEGQAAQADVRKRCALALLEREAPLIAGERILDDRFSYLTAPHAGLRTGTAVLRRTTNYAELIFLFDDICVAGGDLIFRPRARARRTPFEAPVIDEAAGAPRVGQIARDLASGLVSGVGGQIGALIFDAILPSGVPSYFDAVYVEITKIVKRQLTANTIDIINGRLNGTRAWLANTYAPRKRQQPPIPRKDLFDMVTPFANLFYTDAVQTLMLPEFKLPGFSAFMLSAGVHLALFQEQALVDPTVTDPNRSSFAETVRLNARIYADHAAAVHAEIVAQRSRAITLDFVPDVVCAGARCWTVKGYRWDDAHTGKFGQRHGQYTDKDKKYHDGSEEALADLKRYRVGVLGALDATLDKPAQTIALWRRLIDQPIPPPVAL